VIFVVAVPAFFFLFLVITTNTAPTFYTIIASTTVAVCRELYEVFSLNSRIFSIIFPLFLLIFLIFVITRPQDGDAVFVYLFSVRVLKELPRFTAEWTVDYFNGAVNADTVVAIVPLYKITAITRPSLSFVAYSAFVPAFFAYTFTVTTTTTIYSVWAQIVSVGDFTALLASHELTIFTIHIVVGFIIFSSTSFTDGGFIFNRI
jgi:hypothetical protein